MSKSHYENNEHKPYEIEKTGPLSRSFKVELSFTMLDWLRMDKLKQNTSGPPSIDQMILSRYEVLQLCFNVLPKGTSFYKHISYNAALTVEARTPIREAIQLCHDFSLLSVDPSITGTIAPVILKIPQKQDALFYCIEKRQW